MKKLKCLVMLILAIAIISIAKIVNADSTVTAQRIVDTYRGNISFELQNIELSEEKNYVWSIAKESSADGIGTWYALNDYNTSKKTVPIDLVIYESYISNILKTNNTAHIFVKEKDTENFVVNGLQVDLTLPPYNIFKFNKNGNGYSITDGEGAHPIYEFKNIYYNIKKVTDETQINNYFTAVANNTSIENVFNITTEDIENISSWNLCSMNGYVYGLNNLINGNNFSEDGVYVVYLKAKDSNTKAIYGYGVVSVDTSAPTVKSIEVKSPNAGTYKTGQTVKIRVNFSETITGTTVPTLKIKFGNSAERSISNGTIIGNYVEYSYNIQASDVGQLATVDLSGGTIKDASGYDAKLSCPIITGNAIKANTETTSNNKPSTENNSSTGNTENKPSTGNNTSTGNTGNNTNTGNSTSTGNTGNNTNTGNTSNGGNNGSTQGKLPSTGNNSSSNDNTTAQGKLPQTGIDSGFKMFLIAGIFIVTGVIFYFKFNKLKGI